MNLDELLQYTNADVLNRYNKDYPYNVLPAEEALKEFSKFLWLSHKHSQEVEKKPYDESLKFYCAVHREMRDLDDMWHTFLLFTREYSDFCNHYFGRFMHHTPNTENGKPKAEDYEIELTRYLSYIQENLGEATLKKWFLMAE